MLSVKGGSSGRRRYGAQIRPPAKKTVSRDSQEQEVESKPKKAGAELPYRISVKKDPRLSCVPPSTWACAPFRWEPQAFALESERLNQERIIEAQVQDDSLSTWMANPELPVIYGVCGNPNESKAKLFAAYLLSIHCRVLGQRANPVWQIMYGGYDNKLLKDYSGIDSTYEPSILILSNLAPNSTNQKFEKAKDLLERFPSIPRIVIAAGEDPISFLSTRLYVECNALAYFSESLVKRKIEIL